VESGAHDCRSRSSEPQRYSARVRRLAIAVRIGLGRAHFEHADFLDAARALAIEHGPAAVTVGSVTQRLGAPIGSFYHRFASRDVLLAELWLTTVLAFQEGFVAAIEAGDGLAAALHTPHWARANLEAACFLLLHHRDDFVRGEWPDALKLRVAAQARQIKSCVKRFARERFNSTDSRQLRRASRAMGRRPSSSARVFGPTC
jgi:AcrR family transcriptional regulator